MCRLRTPRRPLLVTILLAAIGSGIVYGWSRVAPAIDLPATVAAAAAPPPGAAPVAATRMESRVRPPAGATSAPAPHRLAAEVDRLSRSTNPVDLFAAYKLVTDCVWARDHEGWLASHVTPGDRAQWPSTQAACDDIASDQVQSRLRWLEQAALAGVHHAAIAMAHEGPDGLGLAAQADLDAPEYAPWRGPRVRQFAAPKRCQTQLNQGLGSVISEFL